MIASSVGKRCALREAVCEISGAITVTHRIAFCEALVFTGTIFATLKRILKCLYKRIQYQKIFWCLGRSSVE